MKPYLIRHAESYGNIKGKIISTTDFELTEKGIAQSKRIGQKICSELKGAPISAYCSSLARARQTLIEILRCIGQENAEITETDSLKEMDLGLLEGMTWEERRQKIFGRRYKFFKLDGEYCVDRTYSGKRKPYISIGPIE